LKLLVAVEVALQEPPVMDLAELEEEPIRKAPMLY
jgi:hypothetical protein